jgi:RND family efflux transporter MFP subunit
VASPVKAPISGTVTSIPVQIGSKAAPTTPIAKIAKTGDLELVVYVSEKYISRIAVGLTAVVSFAAFPGEDYRARITEVAPVVDPVTRTLETKMRLINRDRRIKAGMYADVKIITEGKQGIVKIPAGCVVERFGVPYVFVVSGDTVEQREIERGIEIDNKLEVRSGISTGETVVYQGQTLLEDGSRVKVIETVTPIESDDPIL